jgi:hypothetical protein
MEISAFNQSQSHKRGKTENLFGSSAPQRTVFLVLVSVLAWALAAVLVATLRSARSSYPLLPFFYLFVVFHLLPWMIGLRNLRKVRVALEGGKIDAVAAGLSYSLIVGMLVNTYVVLGAGETMAILAYRLGTVHFW